MIIGPKKLVKRAKFFAEILGVSAFDLEISFWKNKNFSGECERLGANDYAIRLTKALPTYFLYRSLAHEMVHLKQYERKELILVNVDDSGFYYWNGELVPHTGDLNEYYLYPWEMEARAYEAYLLHRWETR